MHIFTLFIWIISLVLLFLAAFAPRPYVWSASIGWAGLFAFDLWIGLQFLIVATDPITL
jgi:hypothetical protein